MSKRIYRPFSLDTIHQNRNWHIVTFHRVRRCWLCNSYIEKGVKHFFRLFRGWNYSAHFIICKDCMRYLANVLEIENENIEIQQNEGENHEIQEQSAEITR